MGAAAAASPTQSAAGGPAGHRTRVDTLEKGCEPSYCKGGCDADLTGIMLDSHVFRFVTCQFGQKTGGSPLGSRVRSIARFFARLPTPLHMAS
jgi:hypothetical protein